jgi:hypothetical protein
MLLLLQRRLLSTLAGTVPEHQCYIFLHALDPPSQFPAKMTTPVQRELQLRLTNLGGLVNFSWSPPCRSIQNAPVVVGGRDEEVYSATMFSASGRVDIPEVSLANMDEVEERMRRCVVGNGVEKAKNGNVDSEDVQLYVCTHGSRDCRCGDVGGGVVKALREGLARRNDENVNVDGQGRVEVRIRETAHVGGHKYAHLGRVSVSRSTYGVGSKICS